MKVKTHQRLLHTNEPMKGFHFRIPQALYDQIRELATTEHKSIALITCELLAEGVSNRLNQSSNSTDTLLNQ